MNVSAPQPTLANPAANRSMLYPWIVVGLMTVINACSYIDRTVVGMLVGPIKADLNITDTEFSYLTGIAFAVLYVGFGIPFGWLSDRFSRRFLISSGCAVWSFMTVLCGVVSTYPGLFLARVGVGIGEATLQPCAYPLIGSFFPVERAARPMSAYTMGQPIGSGLAMIIGGSVIGALAAAGSVTLPIVGETKPWQLVFIIVGLPGIVLALLAALVLRDPPRVVSRAEQPGYGMVLRFLWRERKVYLPLIIAFTAMATFAYGGVAWFPAMLMRVYGFTPGETGLFLGLSSSIGGIVGAMAIGSITDHLRKQGRRDITIRVLVPAALGSLLCCALAPLLPVRGLALTLFAGSGLFLLTTTGVYHSVKQAVTPKHVWGQVTALFIFCSNLFGLSVGPTAVALCTDYLFRDEKAVHYSIALIGCVTLGTLVLSLLIGRKAIMHRFGNPGPI